MARGSTARLAALLAWGAASLALPGCRAPVRRTVAGDDGSSPALAVVAEAFLTSREPADNIDSPGVWFGPGGQQWLLATAKGTDQLVVYDAVTGRLLRRVGASGGGLGQFRRPNGLAVWDNAVLVVERDNHRLQVLELPDFRPLGVVAGGILRRPYGLALTPGAGPDQVLVFVTDNYETPEGRVPPDRELGERVRRFSLTLRPSLQWEYEGAFGDTAGAGRLPKVESIWADPAAGLLAVADEAGRALRIYTFEGRFTGRVVGEGLFRHEPEGIALHTCGPDAGYWVATDQDPRENRFLVFRRGDFQYLGAFAGRVIANTDGVALAQRPFGHFARGAFYAVHDDGGLGALDWGLVLDRLGLPADCGLSRLPWRRDVSLPGPGAPARPVHPAAPPARPPGHSGAGGSSRRP